jgi:hypothetical protein
MKRTVLIVTVGLLLAGQAKGALVWTARAAMPAPGRCQVQAHGNVRDTIYLCGGRVPGAIAIRNVYAYVRATNTWITTLPAMPGPRSHGCGDVIDSVIYAAGGFDSSGTARRTTYRFNVNRKTWDTVAAMPSAVFLTAGAKGPGMGTRAFFVFGSQNSGDTLFEFSPGTNTWTTRVPTTRPAGRRAAAAAGTASYFYVMGGIDRGNVVLRDCWSFERRMGGTWTRMTDMPGPRCLHGAITVVGDSVIYVVGGNPTSMGAPCDSIVYKYNIAGNTWSTDTRMPTSRGFLTLEAAGRSIFAIGGINGANYFTTNEEGGWGVGVADNGADIGPHRFRIEPNPVHRNAVITYHIGERSPVTLTVYNACGQVVSTLLDAVQEPGLKKVDFDGAMLPGGVYFMNLVAGRTNRTEKILLLK